MPCRVQCKGDSGRCTARTCLNGLPTSLEKGDVLGVAGRVACGARDRFQLEQIPLRRDVEQPSLNLQSMRAFQQRCGCDGKVEEKIDPQTGVCVEEVGGFWRIDAK